MKETDFSIAKQLYLDSFPVEERRPLQSINSLITTQIFDFLPIKHDGEFAGFANIWHFEHFIYIEHFAVLPNKRNKGIGAGFLRKLQEKYQTNIVVEVEKPDNDTAKRRIEFYNRCGFQLLPEQYIQPPYSEELESVEMRIMLYSNPLKIQPDFLEIQSTLHKQVYNYQCF